MTRYRVNDLPAVGLGAFTPTPTTSPEASSWGLVQVYGAPGTQPIAAPSPQTVGYLPSLTRRGGRDSAQGSEVAPDYIMPAIYVASANNMGPSQWFGMARRRFAELPVPAVDPTRIPTVAQSVPKIAGRRTMAWPRAFQRFPLIGGRSG